ncbi:MAG: SDR family NAD(P)-dependent oxidoreductase [Pseudomonadales bacterium]
MEVVGRTAIITGASSGVGAEVAVKLAAMGASVVVNYANSQAGAEKTLERVLDAGGRGFCFRADVSDAAQCEAMVAETIAQYGGLNILVNNAGTTTYVEHASLGDLTDEIWQSTLGTNLMGPFYMTRAAVPEMEKQGGGEVLMTSSIAGLSTNGSSMAYCASKAGLNSLTRTLAKALGAKKVRVNAICPGLIDGNWASEGWGESWDDVKAMVSAATPLTDIAAPADVADSLISIITGSDLMTGQIITFDGGFSL